MKCLCCSHEDGSVRFWDVSSVDIVLIYKLSTSNLFSLSSGHENSEDLDMDEEWPPFKKVDYTTLDGLDFTWSYKGLCVLCCQNAIHASLVKLSS